MMAGVISFSPSQETPSNGWAKVGTPIADPVLARATFSKAKVPSSRSSRSRPLHPSSDGAQP